MKSRSEELIMLHDILADEINAIFEYAASSNTAGRSNHTELHGAIMEMYCDFPRWLQQRIAFLDHASVVYAIKKGSQS